MAMASSSFLFSNKSINKSSQHFLLNSLCITKQRARISLPKKASFSHLPSNLKTPFLNNHNGSKRYVSIKCTPESSDHLQSFLAADKAWVNWIWGLVALVPLVIQRLLTLTKETEAAAETVEKVADTVEKVAEDVEKLAEDVSEKLPQGGKLKQVVDFVENVAKETAKDARSTEDLMNKVEEVDQQIESIITHGSKANVQESSKDQA
ncbi:OLC1v1017324C1 [Oldenlandia corymbosa var. corymbosa]|uniref:OLC1v1017324C1 n=1 Tax=Oldenlandia corymbosa var. corymbosa TaxID=529605 RepID=A0AAV1E980_OLDCO|nr:OLC1v1017324C1 [Oldenlandia corymbosa var. corymbosa]